MGIKCEFKNYTFSHREELYGCTIEGMQTPENREIELTGKHENGKGNQDVHYVEFLNCTIAKVPQGLAISFPNLKCLLVLCSKLKKISKNDLAEYKNLEKLIFFGNNFEYLPGDLFEGFKDLEFIDFCSRDLKVIEPNILDGLTKLKHVNFESSTINYKCFSIYPVYKPNASLQELKIDLHEIFFARLKFLDDLRKSEQNLQQRVQELVLSQNKSALQIESMKKIEAELSGKLLTSNKSIISLNTQIEDLKVNFGRKSFLTTDIKAFIQDETNKDFKINIDGHEFPVHKFLLAARSPTLAEILKNNPEAENLNLVDISVDIFEIILKFLYTDELPGDVGTNCLHLLAAAGKLKIKELKNYAATKIIDKIDEENALEILRLSVSFGLDDLKQKAFQKVKKKYKNIKFNDELMDNPDKLIKIVAMFKNKEDALKKFNDEFKELMTE